LGLARVLGFEASVVTHNPNPDPLKTADRGPLTGRDFWPQVEVMREVVERFFEHSTEPATDVYTLAPHLRALMLKYIAVLALAADDYELPPQLVAALELVRSRC
jgi:hypothetical protein